MGRQTDIGVRTRGDRNGRRVVVDVDVQRAGGAVAVLVGDRVIDGEQRVVLIVAGRMQDRRILDDRVGAVGRIDRDRQDRDRVPALDLLDEDRAVGPVDIAESARGAAAEQVPGQSSVAARTGQEVRSG